MKILKVIHGYPPLYNAGSEIYSQLLSHGLSRNNEVHVFTRIENSFTESFSIQKSVDYLNSCVQLHQINIPLERYRYLFIHPEVDKQFSILLNQIKPDIIHIGHLNHLSITIVNEIAKKKIPIVYTLHDYWIMCPRGQFIQRCAKSNGELWSLCNAQIDRKCAKNCYSGYFTGIPAQVESELSYWTNWIKSRMVTIKEIMNHVDLFIAPSNYLRNRYIRSFGLPEEKIHYLDYGFDLDRLKNRKRSPDEIFTFGYIGTHIPAKGIQHLIKAFSIIRGNCQLKIWGRNQGATTLGLKQIIANLPNEVANRIKWMSEYKNELIIDDVFNHVDCIVVPSIWVENSPLVIHEALQARVPVITANAGGMAEYIQHKKNGLLFQHRKVDSLSKQMQHCVNNPAWLKDLGNVGYLQSENGNVQSIDEHIKQIENIYSALLNKRKAYA